MLGAAVGSAPEEGHEMIRLRMLRRAGVAAVALALVASACGGDDDDAAGGDDSTQQTDGGASDDGKDEIDACAIVSQEDATEIFGAEATTSDLGVSPVPDQFLDGVCGWDWDSPEADSQLIQFYVWSGKQFFSAAGANGAEAYDIGDEGWIKVVDQSVDFMWLHGDQTVSLSLFTIGDIPDNPDRVDQMKALAAKIDAALG